MEFLSKVANLAMLSFVISSMLAMGAGLSVGQIVDPLRNVRLVGLALLSNFVLVPLFAFILSKSAFARRTARNWAASARLRSRCAISAKAG